MNAVAEQVLQGKLSDPFARKFDAEIWKRRAEQSASEDEYWLFQSALLVRRYVQALLAELEKSAYKTVAASRLVNSLIVSANYLALDFDQRHRKQVRVAKKNQLSAFPRVTLAGDIEFNIADANTSIIDSLRLPLSELASQLDRTGIWTIPELAEDTEATGKMLNLASTWHKLKGIWQECLFFGYRLIDEGEQVVLKGDFDLSYFVVGRARQMHDNAASSAARTYIEEMNRRSAGTVRRPKKRSSRRGLELFFLENDLLEEPDDGSLDDFQRKFVLPLPLDRSRSALTYRQLIQAFDILGGVVGDTFRRAGRRRGQDLDALLDIQCRYSAASLLSALERGLRVEPGIAQHALEILTYNGKGELDPWANPVIDMGDGTCCLLAGVAGPANRSFILDTLMKSEGFDLDSRGEAFEKFVETQLDDAIARCRFKQIVKLSTSGMKARAEKHSEEIDLLLMIGRDLYVIECKCVLFPVEAADEYFFISRMKQAEIQLTRKLAFIRANSHRLNTLHKSLSSFPEPTRIEGMILTTFQAGSAPFSSFPITTADFLEHYFVTGKSMAEFEAGKKGVAVFDKAVVQHYDNFESFRENFWKCQLVQPPVLTFQTMLRRSQHIVQFDNLCPSLKPIVTSEAEVLVPQDDNERHNALAVAAQKLRHHLNSRG